MSEHKTGKSNWTAEQKANYWARRKKGLRGQGDNLTAPKNGKV